MHPNSPPLVNQLLTNAGQAHLQANSTDLAWPY